MLNVALVDDHTLLRNGLAHLLNSFKDYNVTLEAGDGKEFIEQINKLPEKLKPHIVLMDITMPVMNGIETTKWLQENYPKVKVLMLTVMDVDHYILASAKAGASGYLLKDARPAEFKKALDEISATGLYYPNIYKDKIIQLLREDVRTSAKESKINDIWNSLSEQEKTFIKLASSEMTYVQITRKMKLTSSVVEAMRQAVFAKFNVKTRVGLALMAQKNNYLDN